jgi:hypothetical protein
MGTIEDAEAAIHNRPGHTIEGRRIRVEKPDRVRDRE